VPQYMSRRPVGFNLAGFFAMIEEVRIIPVISSVVSMRLIKAFIAGRYPKNVRDFVRMGRGIEARHVRCQKWWEPHLKCTRDFIAEKLTPSKRVLILGAGRLLDVDLAYLVERCEEVHLYDADPSCAALWAKRAGKLFGARVIAHIGDCTETLQAWTGGLSRAAQKGELAAYLRACLASRPSWSTEAFDGVISLNLLGQIPLYWRDRVALVRPQLSQEEVAGLQVSMEALQVAHLQGMLSMPNAWSILITDTEYYFYQSDRSQWEVERALFGESLDLLRSRYGVNAENGKWFWHVSPQFVECDDEGEIHRVEAFYRPPVTLTAVSERGQK
jgi:hypothetical protein